MPTKAWKNTVRLSQAVVEPINVGCDNCRDYSFGDVNNPKRLHITCKECHRVLRDGEGHKIEI